MYSLLFMEVSWSVVDFFGKKGFLHSLNNIQFFLLFSKNLCASFVSQEESTSSPTLSSLIEEATKKVSSSNRQCY